MPALDGNSWSQPAVPVRSVLALQAGLDSAILDPLDHDLRAAILTTELLLGKDKSCRNYLLASREGAFKKKKSLQKG